MRYRLVIFDLDGTLADSFPWFLQNLNGVARIFGFRCVHESEIETLRALGPREILKHLGVPLWKLPRIAHHMRRLKSDQLHAIPLFPGVPAMMEALAANGVVLAIVSSDAEANARRSLGPQCARHVTHYACGASMFGKAAKFKRVLKETGVPAAQTLAIGDEIRDLEAARKAGIAFAAVTWGYSSGTALRACAPDLVFSRLDDILSTLCPASLRQA